MYLLLKQPTQMFVLCWSNPDHIQDNTEIKDRNVKKKLLHTFFPVILLIQTFLIESNVLAHAHQPPITQISPEETPWASPSGRSLAIVGASLRTASSRQRSVRSGRSPSRWCVVFHARLKELPTQLKGPDTGPTVCQSRGNHSNKIPCTWELAIEGTGGVFSQQQSDSAFHSTLSRRCIR